MKTCQGPQKTQQLWEVYRQFPQALVWVERRQDVQLWQTIFPAANIGTCRAWPRRWVQQYWPQMELAQAPRLPSVLGAQWLMEKVVVAHPELVELFIAQGWNLPRLIGQLVRWGIMEQEGYPLPLLTIDLTSARSLLLRAYQTTAQREGIFDYGQQLYLVHQFLLSDPAWVRTLANQDKYWICDDLQEWPPAILTILQLFRPYLDLTVGYDYPHQQALVAQQNCAEFLGLPQLPPCPALPDFPEQVLSTSNLWQTCAQQVQDWLSQGISAAEIVILLPGDDPVAQAHLRQALGQHQFQSLFPEQDLTLSLPGQLVWAALHWAEGTASRYELSLLLEFVLGYPAGSALGETKIQHPWPQQARRLEFPKRWASIFTDLLHDYSEAERLSALRDFGTQLLDLGGAKALQMLQKECILPRWEASIREDKLLVSSPRYFVESRRASYCQCWLAPGTEAWGNISSAYLQTCRQHNRSEIIWIVDALQPGPGKLYSQLGSG